ncbi:hypothetical protein A3E42_01455 [Candidatus Gottesmanbacteria bacterium RIFCSPHIGHO2_12_FULL_40_13]|nr:MAG: hypothetical protein A3E42_01455 [Candidatus Gottesmanbacteria bacterium RIFCSPHIGHO2_12_FULL_40_13]
MSSPYTSPNLNSFFDKPPVPHPASNIILFPFPVSRDIISITASSIARYQKWIFSTSSIRLYSEKCIKINTSL